MHRRNDGGEGWGGSGDRDGGGGGEEEEGSRGSQVDAVVTISASHHCDLGSTLGSYVG